MDISYLLQRKHPFVIRQFPAWEKTQKAYSGGKEYIDSTLIRHISETSPEFAERLRRAHYFNYPLKIARLISQYVLSTEPVRDNAAAEVIEDFDRNGLRADEVMLQLSTFINCYGLGWLLVDMPSVAGQIDMATKQRKEIRPFCRALPPFSVPDWTVGDDGKLLWAIVEEHVLDSSDPYREPKRAVRRRLWTRTDWTLFEVSSDTGSAGIIGTGKHNLGVVPLIKVEEADGYGMGTTAHWFEDVVRISDAILNAESEAHMNIVKQMFGLLVISESFARSASPGTASDQSGEPEKFSHVLARSAAIWESPEEKGISRYITPSGAETATIRSEIQELKKEMFDVVGLAVQSHSREAQTAESKAWDHQNVGQFLATRAMMLEQAERSAWELMNRWDASIPVADVTYNREFSVIDLSSAVAALMDLSSFEAGEAYRKETCRAALDLLDKIRRVAPEEYQNILNEIEKSEAPQFHLPEQHFPEVDASGNENSKGDTEQ